MNEQNNLIENKASPKVSYTNDFKQQVVAVYLSNVYSSVPECAKAYNINPNTLHGWIQLNSRFKCNKIAIEKFQTLII